MNYTQRSELRRGKHLVLATLWRRFAAFLIDWAILVLFYFGLIILSGIFGMDISTINVHSIFDVELEMKNAPGFLVTVMKILMGFSPVLYFTLAFYYGGQTIGKLILRIRVMSVYHERIGLWHCIERSLGYFASALEFGFGYLQAFWNPNRMSLHDKIAETVVVRVTRKQ